MYNKNIAITGSTIEKTTKYDQFREDKIRMELYRRILSLYDEGYRTFSCHLNTYIGLLAADTIVMLRDADKCPDIILSAVIPETPYPAGADKLYCPYTTICSNRRATEKRFQKKTVFKKCLQAVTSSVTMKTLRMKSGRCVHWAFPIPISGK